MYRKFYFTAIIVLLMSRLMAQDGVFNKNYQLAKQLFDKGIIEVVINKANLTDDEKAAFLLAEYYKCSQQDVPVWEMEKVIRIYTPGVDIQSDTVHIESVYFKIINELDRQMHTKDFSYLAQMAELPF